MFHSGKIVFVVSLIWASAAFGQTSGTEREAAAAEMRADAAMGAGKYAEAIPEIDIVLEYIRSVQNEAQKRNLVAKAEKLVFYKAFCLVATEQFEEAVPLLDRFASLYPRSSQLKTALTLKIYCLSSLERWEETRDTLGQVLKNIRVPQDERMELLMAFAEVNRTLGDHEAAFPHFGTVMMQARDPSLKMNAISRMLDTILHLKKTELLYEMIPMVQGRVSPAEYSLQFNLQAIEASDRLAEAGALSPAFVLLKLCKPIEEIRVGLNEVEGYLTDRLEELQSQEQATTRNLYPLIAVQSRLAQVEAEREAALSAFDYNEGLQYRIAQLLAQMDMLYESYWAYDKLLKDYPTSENAPIALYSTSSIAAELGLTERAIEKGKELLNQFPEFQYSPETALNLAYVYEQNQDIENMLGVLQDAIDRNIVTRKERDKGHAFFLMGYANLFLDDVETAGLWFDRVRTEVPKSRHAVDARYWAAYSLMFTDDYPEAITQLEAFLAAHPNSRYAMDATYRLALARFGSGDLEGTRTAAEAFIKAYPDSTLRGEAHNLLGDVYGALGLLDEALDAYKLVEVFTSKPGQVHSAVFNAGRILEADARWPDLIDHFQRYLNRYGEDGFYTRAVYEMGKGYKNSGKTDAVLELYWETFQRFANDPNALGADMILKDYVKEVQEKYIRETTGELANDRAIARKRADSTPEAQEAWNQLSREEQTAELANRERREKRQAEQDRINATEQAKQHVISILGEELRQGDDLITRDLRLRYAMMLAGDATSEPVLISRKMVEAGSPDVLLWLGDLLEQRDNLALAALAYQRVMEDFPDTPATVTSYVKLGTLEFDQGNLDRAMDLFTTVYENYPTSEWTGKAVIRMGDILFRQEQYEEAAVRYEEVVLVREWKGPLWPEALYKNGLSILRGGDTTKAFAYFQRVYVLYASHTEWAARAYLESGKCLELLNRQSEAAQTYREMLKNPALADTPAGIQATKRLSMLPASARRPAHEPPKS